MEGTAPFSLGDSFGYVLWQAQPQVLGNVIVDRQKVQVRISRRAKASKTYAEPVTSCPEHGEQSDQDLYTQYRGEQQVKRHPKNQ